MQGRNIVYSEIFNFTIIFIWCFVMLYGIEGTVGLQCIVS